MRKSILHRIRRDKLKYVSFLMCIIMVSVSINFSGLEGKVYADNSSSNKEQKTINEKREKLINGYNKVKKSKKDNEKCEEVKELKSLRTSNSNTYLMSDGSRKLEIFSEKIRFKENGKYKNYDTLLKNMSDSDREKLSDKAKLMGKNKKGDYILVNCEGDSKQYFPMNISEDSYIVLSKKNYGLSFAPANINELYKNDESIKSQDDNVNNAKNETAVSENSEIESIISESEATTSKRDSQEDDKLNKENENNNSVTLNTEKAIADKVSYCSEDKKIKYNYKSLKHGVKEEIVLNEKPDTNVFEFNLCLSNLKVAFNEYTNDIRFLDEETDKLVAYMDEPFVTDKNGNVNYNNIRYKVDESEDGYKIQIEIDKKYLEFNDTKYPITIDPTAIWTGGELESATVSNLSYVQGMNLKNGSSFRVHNNGISYYPGVEEMCFIDTSSIDANSTSLGSCDSFYGSQIQSANLYVTEKSALYQVGSNGFGYFLQGHIDIKRPIGSPWNVNTITWNNKPSLDTTTYASFETTGTNETNHIVNLKDWAQQIADRSIGNTGLVLKARESGTGANFYSSDITQNNFMCLNIVYKPSHTGDSSIYSYESFDTANGSGKVELNQGNLYYEQKDFDLPSNQLNLGLDRVYNSMNMEQGSFGVGWHCNYEGEIKDVTSDYIVYKDGTGAYFEFDKNNQNEWKCLENEDLSIEIATTNQSRSISNNTYSFTSEYVITDKEKTKRYFDGDKKQRLIEDANGNFIYIKYHSTYKIIEKIYSSAGQYIEMNYTTWNNEHFIGSIALADGSSFNYNYTNDRLTSVTHIGTDDGEITYEYEYNSSGKLKKIIDAKGYFYTAGYDGTSVDEIKYPNNDKFEVFTNYEPSKTRVYKKNSDNDILSYETFEFDNDGKVLKTTNDIGNETTYTYHNSQVEKSVDKVQYYKLQNNEVTLVTPSGTGDDKHLEENNTYNENGDVVSETDEEGNVTEYTYGDSDNQSMPTKTKVTDAEDVVTSEEDSEYDSVGNLTREIDEIQKTVTDYDYDTNGNVTNSDEVLVASNTDLSNIHSSEISSGLNKNHSESTYDDFGNDETNQITEGTVQTSETNTYNSNPNVHKEDILGRITHSKDEKNIETDYTYDEFGRVITTTVTIPNKPTEVSHTSYDENGRITEEIDKYGRHTNFTYDSMGRVISKVLSYENESKTTTTTYGYEENLVIYPGNGRYIVYLIASVITERNESNEVVSKQYNDPYGKLIREEKLGIVSDYTYDKQGNVFSTYSRGISNTNPSTDKVTLTLYNKNAKLTDTIQNPGYSNGSYVIDSSTIVTSNVYDDAGNLIQEKDAKGNITSYEYNAEGKVTKVSLPDDSNQGNNTVYAYDIQNEDASHNIISTKDTTTNAKGNISETEYNGGGQVLSITDKGTNSDITTTYEYDTSGNKTKETTSDGRHISYSYNAKNQMISASHMSANDVVTRYSTYEYNSDDLLYKVVDYKQHNNNQYPYKYTYYEYDDFGKMTGLAEINASSTPSQSTIDDHMLTYTYDIEDKLTEIRYPKTANDTLKGIKLYYNSNKWLTSIKGIVSENNEEIERNVRTYDYYNDSKIKTIKDYRNFLSGGSAYINKEYQYDAFDRVISMEYRDSSSINTILEKHTYSYDKNNNILSEGIINNYPQNNSDKINETREYTYDDLNRLKTTTVTNNNNQTEKNTSYSYDKVGNITRIEEDSKVTVNTYNEFNQLITSVITNNNTLVETKNFTYDANGNQIQEQTLDDNNDITETITKSYDNEGHMTRWSCYNGGTNGSLKSEQLNTYSNDGKRCLRVDDEDVNDYVDVRTRFFYQGDTLLYTTDSSGNKKSQNIVGPQNNIIATIQYDDGQHVYYYNKDIRTSVTNIVDESGNGVARYQYDDFGETTKLGDTDFYNEICYTSGVYDELTEEYYLNARYYDPVDRTFTTQDSYRGEQKDYHTWNMYAYCGGNPINTIDPSGHNSVIIYHSEFYSNVKGIKSVLSNLYKKKKITVKQTNNYTTFKKTWNGFKKKKKCVVIVSHANPLGLINVIGNQKIKKLKKKKVKKLVLFGCNAGHLDHAYDNPAYNFKQKIDGSVIASDGTVETDYYFTKKSVLDSKGDDGWKKYRINKTGHGERLYNLGWVKYSSRNNISALNKKSATLKQLIKS